MLRIEFFSQRKSSRTNLLYSWIRFSNHVTLIFFGYLNDFEPCKQALRVHFRAVSPSTILEINRVARTSNHVNRLTYVRNFCGRAYLALLRDQHQLCSQRGVRCWCRCVCLHRYAQADAAVLRKLLVVSYRFAA